MQPEFPRQNPPYRVHYNWEIFKACNYRCRYCPTYDNKADCLRLSTAQWEVIWDRLHRLYGSGEIRFTGGEPTCYPGFIELVELLQKKFTINITTNLSFDADKWIQQVTPGNVFLSASLHPDHVGNREFLEKNLTLWKHKHYTTVCFVAYPPHLDAMVEAQKMFEEHDIIFKIVPFNGEYQGKKYPAAYSQDQNRIVNQALEASKKPEVREMNKALQGFHLETPAEAALCRMGEMYAKIDPDGNVKRCCSEYAEAIGHITDENFRLNDAPKECSAPCKCWKPMVIGKYEDKRENLWHMPEHTPPQSRC